MRDWDLAVEKFLDDRLSSGKHGLATSGNCRMVLSLLGGDLDFPDPGRIDQGMVSNLNKRLRSRLKTAPVRGGAPRVMKGRLSDASVASYLRIFKAFCSWLVDQGVLMVHPMEGMRHPNTKRTKVKVFYSKDERDLLLDGCEREDVRLVFLLGFYAGLRKGEMLAMNWDWVWLGDGSGKLTVMETDYFLPKSKELREVPIHPLLRCELERLLKVRKGRGKKGGGSDFVLRPDKYRWKQAPKERVNLRRRCAGRCVEVGLPWTGYHRLRHSFATHLAIGGCSIAEIASLLGVEMSVAEKHYAGFMPGRDVLIIGL